MKGAGSHDSKHQESAHATYFCIFVNNRHVLKVSSFRKDFLKFSFAPNGHPMRFLLLNIPNILACRADQTYKL